MLVVVGDGGGAVGFNQRIDDARRRRRRVETSDGKRFRRLLDDEIAEHVGEDLRPDNSLRRAGIFAAIAQHRRESFVVGNAVRMHLRRRLFLGHRHCIFAYWQQCRQILLLIVNRFGNRFCVTNTAAGAAATAAAAVGCIHSRYIGT